MSEHDEPQRGYEVLASGPAGTATVVPDGDAPAGPSRRRRWVAAGAAAAVVLAAGAGAVAVGAALGGGGAQPETVVPADAVFYAELDLDPAAGQKVDAFRFLRRFPALKNAFTADGGYGPDFARLFDDTEVDYATDIQPWLGKRFAAALVPGDAKSDPARVMVVLQTTDEGLARDSLTRVLEKSDDDHFSVAVSGGYAVLAATLDFSLLTSSGRSSDDGLAERLVARAGEASLADAATYTAAVEPYGDSVATVWSDNEGVAAATEVMTAGLGLGAGALGPATSGTGTSVAVLRFDGDALEVVGSSTGSTVSIPSGGVPAVSSLPESTLLAVGGNDVGTLLKATYGPMFDQIGSLALGGSGELGSAMDPDRWPTLFGEQTVFAVGGEGAEPLMGLHVVGGQKTVDAIDELVAQADEPVVSQRVGDGVVVATDPTWADRLAEQGSFGESPRFRAAVPDAGRAGVVAFVDVDRLLERMGSELSADDRANLEPLEAVGISMTSDGGTTTFRVRVLAG